MAFCPGREDLAHATYRAGFLPDGKIHAVEVELHVNERRVLE